MESNKLYRCDGINYLIKIILSAIVCINNIELKPRVQFSKMIQTVLSDISKFLTESVIEKAFKEKTGSNEKVQYVEVTRAAAAGEGLLSAVYRVRVKSTSQSASFIVKGLVKSEVLRESLECSTYFAREITFFKDILPALINVQKTLGAKESIQNYVPMFYNSCADGENDYILMEDLSESNFVSISEHPTESERDKVLKTLAHLHAVSIALKIKEPKVFQGFVAKIPEIYYSKSKRDWYNPYLMKAVELDRQVLKEYLEQSSVYLQRFEEIVSNDLYGNLISSVSSSVENQIFCHGDAWCPNFLCSTEKAVAIDFQLYRCSSLATDLVYFIMLCGNLCEEKQDFFDAVDVYYKELSYFLGDMGLDASQVFSRGTLDKELKKHGSFGFMACVSSIPLMAGERMDCMAALVERPPGQKKVPLETLWKLSPIKNEHKNRVLNLVRVSVDAGII